MAEIKWLKTSPGYYRGIPQVPIPVGEFRVDKKGNSYRVLFVYAEAIPNRGHWVDLGVEIPSLAAAKKVASTFWEATQAGRNPRALPGTVSLDSKPRGGKEPFYAENLYHCKKCNARHLRYSGIGRRHFSLRRKGK